MRAVTAGKPGQVQYMEFPEPRIGVGEVIIRPTVVGICSSDVKRVLRGEKDPQYALGHEVAGVVVEADPASGWEVGARVVSMPYLPCGECHHCRQGQATLCPRLFESSLSPGGLAERIGVPSAIAERGMFRIPEGLMDEVAALSEPVGCVLKGIHDSGVQPGDAVLIIGDGPIGIMAAAVANAYGAQPVMVAGMMAHRLAVAEREYAHSVIDVGKQALVPEVQQLTEGRGADVVIVAVPSGEALESGLEAVRPGGTVNAFAGVPNGTTVLLDVRRLHYEQIHLTGSFGVGPSHLAEALGLLHSGKVKGSPVITARFAFEEAGEAISYAAQRVGLKPVVVLGNQGRGES